MDIVKKYKELKKKDCVQLIKELNRRGLTSSCSPDDEKVCRIIAYDAYNAGRSAGLEEARKGSKDDKNTVAASTKERSNIVLRDEANDEVTFLKVTKDQKDLLEYLMDNDWLTDVSFTEATRIKWDEP